MLYGDVSLTLNPTCLQTLPDDCVFSTEFDIWTGLWHEEPEILTKKKVQDIVKRFTEWDLEYAKKNPQFYGACKIPQGEGERYNRLSYFINHLVQLKKIQREGKYHNPLCEYALGTDCSCWCSEKYHGLKGAIVQ